MINASSGGSFGDMTPNEISEQIEKVVVESKHYQNEDKWYVDQPMGIK